MLLDRVSDELFFEADAIAEKLAKKVARELFDLDKCNNWDNEYFRGYLPWMLVRDRLDSKVSSKLGDLIQKERRNETRVNKKVTPKCESCEERFRCFTE